MFRQHDERRLVDDYKVYSDTEKHQERARSDAANLEQLFDEDAASQLSNKVAVSDRLKTKTRTPAMAAAKKDK